MKNYLYQEFISQQNTDLNKVYNKLNNIIYNGKLPDINLMWADNPEICAKTMVDGNENDPSTWQIKGIQFSTSHPITHKDLLAIMAHEMIHVNRVTKGIRDPEHKHNQEFNMEVQKINNMNLGFQIPFVENSRNFIKELEFNQKNPQ